MESGLDEDDVWRMCLCWPAVWKLTWSLAIVSEREQAEQAERAKRRFWHQAKRLLLMKQRTKRRAFLSDGTTVEKKAEGEEEEEERIAERISSVSKDWKKEEKVSEESSKDVQTEERDAKVVPIPEKSLMIPVRKAR